MGRMKDYLMWLEHNGYSESDSDDDLIIEYKNDTDWHQTQPSHSVMIRQDGGDYLIEDDDDTGVVIDDGDYDGSRDMGWTPEDQWFRSDGGLTGEAWDFLATTDSEGDFI